MQTNPLALFGDHLARLRKARGWSQEKLALESGLARSYVSGIERGRRNVALVNICVLADTLGVPTSEMLRFAQAAPGAADATASTDRTPLPQISRSLCRLENRDQVWLAEIIRSLSSRLSQAAPPPAGDASTDTCASSDTSPDSSVDDEREDPDGMDGMDDANAACAAFASASGRPTAPPGFDAGVSRCHQLAAPVEQDYAMAENSDALHPPARIREPQRAPSDSQDACAAPDIPVRSEAITREDPPRFPISDEE